MTVGRAGPPAGAAADGKRTWSDRVGGRRGVCDVKRVERRPTVSVLEVADVQDRIVGGECEPPWPCKSIGDHAAVTRRRVEAVDVAGG